MHGSYRRNFGPENVEELNQSIDIQHEELLKTDDLDKKADFLRYLAGYAMQYLYLVPHNKKFIFRETERVLHSSAMMICDFDPREASLAFEHLARYSHNLLEQPWRQDFHSIKLTSGFYVHNVAAHIHNAHELLIAMGYVNTDDVTLKLLPTYNIQSLKAVSRDCYVASQECLILSQIWQRVSDQEPEYPLTIAEVFEFRVKYLGDTDTICKTLLSDIRRRQHEYKMSKHASQQFQSRHFVPVEKLIDYDGMDVENSNGYNYPEREKEIVKKVLENTKLQQEESHIYDPVCNGRIYSENGYGSPFSPTPNSGANNFIFPGKANSHYKGRWSDSNATIRDNKYDRNSLSPMIPQTVANFCSRSPNRNLSQSSSPGSVNSRGAINNSNNLHTNGHLSFSKVADHEKSRNENLLVDEHGSSQSGRSRKPISAYSTQNAPVSGRKSLPVSSYEAYRSTSGNGYDYMDDNDVTGEDVLNEALEYASEINGLVPENRSNKSGQGRNHQPVKSGWETDSRSASSASRVSVERDSDKKSASSTDASSWDNVYRLNHSDSADGYPPHHNLEKVNNSRQASINKVNAKPTAFVGTASPEARGLKLYSQPHTVLREQSYEYDANRYSTQMSRQRDNVSEFHNQYSRKSSCSSSSPSPHQFTQLPRSYDKSDSIDVELRKFLEQSNIMENPPGPKSQSSFVQPLAYDPKAHEQKNLKQFDVVPQSSFARKSGTSSGLPHLEESVNGVECDRNRHRESGSNVHEIRIDRDHNDLDVKAPINQFVDSTVRPLENNTIRPVVTSSNFQKLEQFTNLESVKKCDPEREGSKGIVEDHVDAPKPMEPWECRFCTLINKTSERICEVCAKSKDFVEEPEELPILKDNANIAIKADSSVRDINILSNEPVEQIATEIHIDVIPGTACKPDEIQCTRCTLLNNAIAKSCEACGFRLREINSPSRGAF